MTEKPPRLVMQFTWTDDSVELYRKFAGEEDAITLTDPLEIARFTLEFMDFLKERGSYDDSSV